MLSQPVVAGQKYNNKESVWYVDHFVENLIERGFLSKDEANHIGYTLV